jgi:YVTN family beta-propeller protein
LLAGAARAATFTFTNDADWGQGTLTNTHSGPPPAGAEGTVRLNDAILTPFNHIWVALSGRDAVVRINTDHVDADRVVTLADSVAGNGAVLGEYLTRPNGMQGNPSRTTVDQNGDVWVGNRNEGGGGRGSITKISADATGSTSTGVWNGSTFNRLDWTNAGGADTNGGTSTAQDTAMLQYVRTLGANVRHVSVDASNNVWAGGGPLDAGDQVFELRDGATGAVIPTAFGNFVPDNNTGGYGGLVDGNGVVWSAGLNSNTLTRFDPATGARMTVNQSGRQSYGLGIDNNGVIWNATWTNNTLDKIGSNGVVQASYNLGAVGNSLRGVAVTPDNDIWVAASGSGRVIRVHNDGSVAAVIGVGSTPTGVAVDSNGKVWVTNFDSNNVMRIDPATNTVDLTVDLGPNARPYNYSDMTGTVLTGSTNPQGTWRRVLNGGAGATWDQIFWNTEVEGVIPTGTDILMEVCVSDDPLSCTTFQSYESGDLLGLTGQYLEVRATLSRIGGTQTTPVLSDLTLLFTPGSQAPEPGTLLLLGLGLLPLAWRYRRAAS